MEQLTDAFELVSIDSGEKTKSVQKTKEEKKKTEEKIHRLAELIKIFTKDSEDIFAMLDEHYSKDYKLCTLMFDGDFLLDSYDEEKTSQIKGLSDKAKFYLQKTKPVISKSASVGAQVGAAANDDRKVIIDFLAKIGTKAKPKGLGKRFDKDGFTIQYEEIIKIANNVKYKDRIIPFLGVDPRRPNIKELVKSEVGKGKLFAGIKVYPPNGFSPMDKELVGLDSIFEFCNNNQIPIVSHCSYGGFATPAMSIDVNGMIIQNGKTKPEIWDGKITFEKGLTSGFNEMVKERAGILNHPKIWRKVLEKYENLILVLAHFGSGSDDWQNEIVLMMKQYPNLYTDISCMSDEINLEKVKVIYDNNPDIHDKILYGSDYFLDMFFNDSFDDYLKRIQDIFNYVSIHDDISVFEKLTINNPFDYMQKWYKAII
jgi:predicted TIM-barrel fold metal-dependent hydrolase